MKHTKKTSHPARRLTERRINLIWLVYQQLEETYKASVKRDLYKSEEECLGMMAEDIAFKLPQDTTFGSLSGTDADTIMEYTRDLWDKEEWLRSKQQATGTYYWNAFRRWVRRQNTSVIWRDITMFILGAISYMFILKYLVL